MLHRSWPSFQIFKVFLGIVQKIWLAAMFYMRQHSSSYFAQLFSSCHSMLVRVIF